MPFARLTVGLICTLAFAMVLSLHLGLRLYTPTQVWAALTGANTGTDALIINGLRVPRTLAACGVGSALAVCGVLMQSVLRNPLADPGLLGGNAGASFAVVFGFSILGITSLAALSGLALIGAAGTTTALFALIALSRGRLTPMTLVLAGVTLSALLAALTQVLIVIDEGTMEALLFWLAGGFADRDAEVLTYGLPVVLICIAATILLAHALDALQVGDTAAKALGVGVSQIRIIALGLATVMAAICVTIAGPIGVVGLVAPHLARLCGASQHRAQIIAAALIGATLTVLADIGARLVVAPQEVPVSAILALIGAPFLVGLVRRQVRHRAVHA